MKNINIDKLLSDGLITLQQIHTLLFLDKIGFGHNFVVCGSLGLVLNNKLDRPVNDIDLLCRVSMYGEENKELRVYEDSTIGGASHQFWVMGDKITCWKINPLGVKVDLLYNPSRSDEDCEEVFLHSEVFNYHLQISIEKPEIAIEFKKKYVENDKSEDSRKKHQIDIDKWVSGEPVNSFYNPSTREDDELLF